MRVRASIAIAVAVGVLALGLLLVGREPSRSRSDTGPRARAGATDEPESRTPRARAHGLAARDGDPAGDASSIVGGSLIHEDTGPLSEGRVDLWCDDGQLGSRARIDADGNFAGPACSGRTCARLVHAVFDQPEAWVLEPGVARELTVAVAPRIAGTVVSTTGEPIADAKLLLRQEPRRASARTDVDGTFAVSLPSRRPCDPCDGEAGGAACRSPNSGEGEVTMANLSVWAAEFAPQEVEVLLDRDASLEVVLSPPAPPLTGRIIGPDGGPAGPRTMVLATNVERDVEQHAAEVDVDGSFVFADLAHGRYRIRAIRDGHELAVLDSAAPGERVELRVAQAMQGRDLHVEVRDDGDRPTPAVWVDGGPFRGAKTDARGRVEAHDVLPGSYTLSVRVTGCSVIRTRVEVGAGRDAVHQLVRLPATCVISGPD